MNAHADDFVTAEMTPPQQAEPRLVPAGLGGRRRQIRNQEFSATGLVGRSGGRGSVTAAGRTPRSTAAGQRMHAAVTAFRFGAQAAMAVPGQRPRRRTNDGGSGDVESGGGGRDLGPVAEIWRGRWPSEPLLLQKRLRSASPERSRSATSMERQADAAAHVQDAFLGELVLGRGPCPWAQKLFAQLLWPRRATMLIYITFAFLERPSWCYHEPHCDAPPDEPGTMLFSGLPVLRESITQGIELGCLACFGLELSLKWAWKGGTSFWENGWNKVKLTLITLSLIDVGSFWVSSDGLIVGPLRLAPLIRPFLVVVKERRLRETSLSILGLLWTVRYVLSLIVFLVIWFGMVLFVLFDQYCPGPPRVPDCDQSVAFGTLGRSYLSVLIMLTTANFPDVIMPAYTYSRWFVLPFVAFMLFGLFFLMNVVLANIYSACEWRPCPASNLR